MWMIKLPHGPTAHFKLTSVVLPKRIAGHGRPTAHRPELILNHFSTRLGHRLGRMLATLFPHDPQFKGRQARRSAPTNSRRAAGIRSCGESRGHARRQR